jgi:hypothetical protein
MDHECRQFDFDPSTGIPLETWMANMRARGWRPVRGARAIVRTPAGNRLCMLMRKEQLLADVG